MIQSYLNYLVSYYYLNNFTQSFVSQWKVKLKGSEVNLISKYTCINFPKNDRTNCTVIVCKSSVKASLLPNAGNAEKWNFQFTVFSTVPLVTFRACEVCAAFKRGINYFLMNWNTHRWTRETTGSFTRRPPFFHPFDETRKLRGSFLFPVLRLIYGGARRAWTDAKEKLRETLYDA